MLVTVTDTSNYKSTYSEAVPFEAKVIEKYDIHTLVESLKTGKKYELYTHQYFKS